MRIDLHSLENWKFFRTWDLREKKTLRYFLEHESIGRKKAQTVLNWGQFELIVARWLIKLKTKNLKRISLIKLKATWIFWWYEIEGEFLIRVLSALNPPSSLSVSLRGPAKHYVKEQKGERAPASLMKWDGMGWDGEQKCPLIFFILRYIKH